MHRDKSVVQTLKGGRESGGGGDGGGGREMRWGGGSHEKAQNCSLKKHKNSALNHIFENHLIAF